MTKDFSTVLDDLATEMSAAAKPAAPAFDLKRLITLRAPLMIGVAIALAIPLSIAGWFLTPTLHTATADLRFLSLAPRVLDGSAAPSIQYDKFVNTHVGMITGSTILMRVLDEPAIKDLPGLADVKDKLQFLKDRVSARVVGRSELVNVTFTMPDRTEAKMILQQIIDSYLTYAHGEEASAGGERLRILTKERDSRQLELDLQLRQLSELQAAVGTPEDNLARPETTEADLYRENLLRAQEELSKTESGISDVEVQVQRFAELQQECLKNPGKPIFELGVEDRVNADPRVSALRQDLVRAEANVAHLSARLIEGSPQLRSEKKNLQSLKSSVDALVQTVRMEVLSSMKLQLEQQKASTLQSASEAKARVEKYAQLLEDFNRANNEKLRETAGKRAAIEELRAKSEETKNLLQNLRRQITEISLESNAPARVQLASPADVPALPGSKRQLMVVVLAVFASIGAGLAAGVLRELTDQQVRSPQDVMRLTPVPVVATIPHSKEDRLVTGSNTPMLTADHPNSTSADEFRRVLSRLLYPENSAELNSVVIVSPTIGDGKTSVACNLAIALEQANRRVLLVDLNAQRPQIEQCFGLSPAPGLGDILSGEYSAEELIRATSFEGLSVLGPGHMDELAGRVASREMLEFLEFAEEHFQHVLIDTPPALLVSDAKLLAPVADGVLVVVGVGKSSRGMVTRCLRGMESGGANIIGIVLNGMRRMRGGYLGDNMKLYYSYSKERGNGRYERDIPEMKIVDDDGADFDPVPDEEPAIVLLPYNEQKERKHG